MKGTPSSTWRLLACLVVLLVGSCAARPGTAFGAGTPRAHDTRTAAGVLPALRASYVGAPSRRARSWATSPSLSLTARQASSAGRAGGEVKLLAHLTARDRASNASTVPVPGVVVRFSVRVKEFSGAPGLVLGSVTTNSSGNAVLAYRPSWSGAQQLVATAQGAAGATLASATATIVAKATDPFAGTVEASRAAGAIGRWVVVALLLTVAVLWVVLLGFAVRVHQGGASQ